MPGEPRGSIDLPSATILLPLLILPVVLPPMTHPWSGALCAALAAGALALMAWRPETAAEARVLLLFVPFAAVSILAATCRARALDQGAALAVLLIAALVARLTVREERVRSLSLTLIALGCGVSVLALVQRTITYPHLAAALRALDPADPTGALVRLEAGRPSGPFILPAALGGFIALTLPVTIVLTIRARPSPSRIAGAVAVMLQIVALSMTRSIGGLTSAVIGILVILPVLAPRLRGATAAAVIVAGVLCAALFIQARRGEFLMQSGGDPLSLRAGNWRSAVEMVTEHPLFGVGPGSFGTIYPRTMRPGMNETRYAHNTYLQAAAGWGLWILVPITMLLLCTGRALRREWADPGGRLPLLAGGVAFLAHNLVDFTAYLPGVAIPAAIVLGAGIGRSGEKPRRRWSRPAQAGMILAVSVTAGLLAIHGMRAARSESLMDRAREAAIGGSIDRSLVLARGAAAVRPADPDPYALIAELILAHRMDRGGQRAEGESAATRALELNPESAVLHFTRALYHAAAGESAAAFRERYAAQRLNPLKRLYRGPVKGGER